MITDNIKDYEKKYILNSIYINEINSILNSINMTTEELSKSILNKYNINIDYDDVLVEFSEEWINYVNNEFKNFDFFIPIKIEDLDSYDSMEKINNIYKEKNPTINFKTFFDRNDFYSYIKPKKGAIEFINKLKKYNFKNFQVLSATVIQTVPSKQKHFIETFNLTKKHIKFSNNKTFAANFTYGTLLDDRFSNLLSVVQENPFSFVCLFNTNRNKGNLLDKRIFNCNNFEEYFELIPFLAAKNLDRLLNRKELIKEIIF
jgi:hypothetical protein